MLELDQAATLLSRAMRCETIEVVACGPSGARTTAWRREGAHLRAVAGSEVPSPAPLWLFDQPVGSPVLAGRRRDRLRIVVRRSPGRTVGWELCRSAGFVALDLSFATSMLAVFDADPSTADRRGINSLTERQIDILTLISEGFTAEAVARRIGISARTVHKHLENAYRKIGCHDRVSAVLFVSDMGLLRRPDLAS